MHDLQATELIFETTHWKVLLMPDQLYLGRSVVVLKRACGDLAEVTPDELLDFLEVVKKYQQALSLAFGATMFNWSCLMNHAYQQIPYTPQVHWHVRPRYNKSVKFGGHEFIDTVFGKHYLMTYALNSGSEKFIAPLELQQKIVDEIRRFLD